eukprot:9581571-Ditylum_brightwellii.AAC.1
MGRSSADCECSGTLCAGSGCNGRAQGVLGEQEVMANPVFDDCVTHLVNESLVLTAKGVDFRKWNLWEDVKRERDSIAKVDAFCHEVDEYLLVGRALSGFVVLPFECLVKLLHLCLVVYGCEGQRDGQSGWWESRVLRCATASISKENLRDGALGLSHGLLAMWYTVLDNSAQSPGAKVGGVHGDE